MTTVQERKRIWTCGGCGKDSVWGDTWQWYGSMKDWDDSLPVAVACSQECMAKAVEGYCQARKVKPKPRPRSKIIQPAKAFAMLQEGKIDLDQFYELYLASQIGEEGP